MILRAFFGLCLAFMTLAGPATAQQGYRIQPGDVIRVEVLEDETLNRDLLVLPDGRVTVPLAGAIRASGRTVGQVQTNITSALSANFARDPTVYVGVSRLAERPERPAPEPVVLSIYILGEANTPGLINVEPGTTVLQMFAQMGGFTNFAAIKRIQLRRTDDTGTERIFALDYKAIQEGRSRNGLTTLMDGDVIVVPQRRLFE